MDLPPLSREGCSSTPVLIDRFISLVKGRFYLVESTKYLLKHIDECVEVDISDRPPAMLAFRAMLEASESSEELKAKKSRQSSLENMSSGYSTEVVEGASSQSNGSFENGATYHSPPTLRNHLGLFSGSYGDSSVLTTCVSLLINVSCLLF